MFICDIGLGLCAFRFIFDGVASMASQHLNLNIVLIYRNLILNKYKASSDNFSPSDNISSTEMRNELIHVKFNLATPLQATTDII